MLFTLLTLHLVVGIFGVAAHRRLGRRGFVIAAVPLALTLAWLAPQLPDIIDGEPIEESVTWAAALDLSFDLRVDAFAALMVLLVSGIGVLVCWYALSYFSHAGEGTGRLAGLLTLFAGAMVGLVVSDHLLSLFVFWELTTITSYLLIGNDDRRREARDAALMALLVTGAGGLAMLAGLVMLGQAAGTYRLSELEGSVPSTGVVSAAAVLILIGAFTKSAQYPFSAWLPGAMVAPTPISTYLHAATMVKAGVFLLARLAPSLHTIDLWAPTVIVVGGVTMAYGGWRALRQHDLKLLLAYGTVSQLGFLTMLCGVGEADAARAGATLLLAHGAFKAALFMVVGIVDHQAGTRDVRRIARLGREWRPVIVVAVISAASMAGIPPLLGFVAKEAALEAALHEHAGMVVAIVVGSVLTVAYSARMVLGLLGQLSEPGDDAVTEPPPPTWGFAAPAAFLTAFTVAAGIAPVLVDDLVGASVKALYPGSEVEHLHLWAGFTTAFALSVVIIAAGLAITVGRRPVARMQRAVHGLLGEHRTTENVFWSGLSGLLSGARRVTVVLQNGSLPVYLLVILAVAALAPLGPAIAGLDGLPAFADSWLHIPAGIVIAAAAIGATVVRRRIAAALLLGGVGYGMAWIFVVQGAPDLALTQFAIETLATVMFVLVLRFLPPHFEDRRPPVIAPLRLIVSVMIGVSVFVLALMATSARSDIEATRGTATEVSEEMIARSVPDGEGANVVNVILVDFRGLDTMGEITVLVAAALGTLSLARSLVRWPSRRARATATAGAGVGFARLPVVVASARLLFPSLMVLSVYFLFVGHNRPGGGFVGGLVAGAAISLRYISGGVSAVRATLRPPPWIFLGGGLALSVGTALFPLLLGESILEHASVKLHPPLIGDVKVTSALPFDVGVYFVVIGLVLMAFEAFGDDVRRDTLLPEGVDGDGVGVAEGADDVVAHRSSGRHIEPTAATTADADVEAVPGR